MDLIIFDCDGVLIDSEVLACRELSDTLATLGVTESAETIAELFCGSSFTSMTADLQRRHAVKLTDEFAQTYRTRLFTRFETELRETPGLRAVLDGLACKICIASGSSPDRLKFSLSLVGLYDRFFPHIFSDTQVKRGKPAPDLFLLAAATLGAAPPDCVVIEDSLAGVIAAKAAGMRVIGFCGGGHCSPAHERRLLDAGADAVTGTMPNLATLLARF